MAENLCEKCAALCCRYIALPIDNPEDVRDFDNIRWYLMHENIVVFVEEAQWYIGFFAKCKNLQANNMCGVYLTRPRICRTYTTENCDYHGGEYGYELLFTSADQLLQYAEKTLKRKLPLALKKPKLKKRIIKGKKHVLLPVI